MLQEYLPILIFLLVGMALAVSIAAIGWFMGLRQPSPHKNAAYECGFDAFEDARLPFDVRYYLVAILFILFDLETAFFFPWAVVLRQIGIFGLVAMSIFLGLLIIAFIFEWRKGGLEWE